MENMIADLLEAVEKEAQRENFDLPQRCRDPLYFLGWEGAALENGVDKTAKTIVEFLQLDEYVLELKAAIALKSQH